ncbi:MAG: ATP-binding cassette domain-containing protein [Bacilli bacterium]|jgi:oligopeptide transport system ATP-binding protein|nr:ATP-binding cassette domain-containing protein [Bacilli bacterium]
MERQALPTIDFATTVGPVPAGKEVKLSVRNLAISFYTDKGRVHAVRGVSFDLYRGETLCIVGESGSGKSVTSRTIMGILAGNGHIDSGSVTYEGEDLTKVSEEEFHRIRGDKIGMIFQDPLSSLNPIMRIGKQITEVMVINGNHLKHKRDEIIKAELVRLKNDERLLSITHDDFIYAKKSLNGAKKHGKTAEEIKTAEAEFAKKKAIYEANKAELGPKIKEDRKALADKKRVAAVEVKKMADKLKEDHKGRLGKVVDAFKHNHKLNLFYKSVVKEHREYISNIRVTQKEAKARALKVMAEVGIPSPEKRFSQYPFEFSGGMRQRIVIAIALTANPDVLICDEPTTALDVTIQAQILELINRLKAAHHMSVIFITHDLGVVANMADRVAVMYAGKIVEFGTAADVFYHPVHPYTWALLSSIPDVDSKERLEAIPGTPPNMIYPPKGDAFALRSKYAIGIDFKEEPPMYKLSDTHYASTWLLDPRAPKAVMPKIVSTRIENSLRKAGLKK